MSFSSRSKVSDHRWNPVSVSINWAVMRTLGPDCLTLPSSTWATPSCSPISLRSLFSPLNWNDDVRPATLSPGILARTFSNSSDRPSEKYSLSIFPLMLTNGNTAIDFSGTLVGVSAAWFGVLTLATSSSEPVRISLSNSRKATATTSAPMIMKSSLRPVCVVIDSRRSTSFSRLMPLGVISNAQAKIKANGKPIRISAAVIDTVHSGSCSAGNMTSTTCIMIHAAMI
ncbi:hypothetical protein MnTg04_00928 [bacterium MnTg04]|nr:hypothetical protein MnTg04_00928 [bacterium MnTg04]